MDKSEYFCISSLLTSRIINTCYQSQKLIVSLTPSGNENVKKECDRLELELNNLVCDIQDLIGL